MLQNPAECGLKAAIGLLNGRCACAGLLDPDENGFGKCFDMLKKQALIGGFEKMVTDGVLPGRMTVQSIPGVLPLSVPHAEGPKQPAEHVVSGRRQAGANPPQLLRCHGVATMSNGVNSGVNLCLRGPQKRGGR